LSIEHGMAALAGLIESTIYALKVNQSAFVRCFTPMCMDADFDSAKDHNTRVKERARERE